MRIQAISQMTRETATMAFCLPRLRAIRRYIAPRRVSVLAAVIAACPSAAQVPVPLAGAAGPGCLPGLLAAGGQPGPSGGVPGRGELRGVGAELGDDGPAVDGADAGDLIQPFGEREKGNVLVLAAGNVAAADQTAGGAGRRGAGNQRQLPSDLVVQVVIASISRRCTAISVA
jgi:hypothetical protein